MRILEMLIRLRDALEECEVVATDIHGDDVIPFFVYIHKEKGVLQFMGLCCLNSIICNNVSEYGKLSDYLYQNRPPTDLELLPYWFNKDDKDKVKSKRLSFLRKLIWKRRVLRFFLLDRDDKEIIIEKDENIRAAS